eukprot:scaffold718_cov252-Pinguiococcus_pyrenoidosus.AAC.5
MDSIVLPLQLAQERPPEVRIPKTVPFGTIRIADVCRVHLSEAPRCRWGQLFVGLVDRYRTTVETSGCRTAKSKANTREAIKAEEFFWEGFKARKVLMK